MKQNTKRHKNNLESTHFPHDDDNAIAVGLTEKDMSVIKTIENFDQDEINELCSLFNQEPRWIDLQRSEQISQNDR